MIHHIDAYRLEGDADAEDLALAELLDSGGIVVVEWAERLTLPADRLDLHFAYPPEPHAAPATSNPPEPHAVPAASNPPGTNPPEAFAPDPATVHDLADATDHRIATVTLHGPTWQAHPSLPQWSRDL